jgi:DNA-binding transcriptional MerR regulator
MKTHDVLTRLNLELDRPHKVTKRKLYYCDNKLQITKSRPSNNYRNFTEQQYQQIKLAFLFLDFGIEYATLRKFFGKSKAQRQQAIKNIIHRGYYNQDSFTRTEKHLK